MRGTRDYSSSGAGGVYLSKNRGEAEKDSAVSAEDAGRKEADNRILLQN